MTDLHFDQYNLPTLRADNYDIWSFRLAGYLKLHSLWSVVDGESTVSNLSGSSWHESNDQALRIIRSTLEADEDLRHLAHLKTAHAAWQKLKDIHAPADFDFQGKLVRQLFEASFSSSTMRQHLSSLTGIRNRLAISGVALPDTLFCHIVLNSLPASYANLRQAYYATVKSEDVNVANLHERILIHEMTSQGTL